MGTAIFCYKSEASFFAHCTSRVAWPSPSRSQLEQQTAPPTCPRGFLPATAASRTVVGSHVLTVERYTETAGALAVGESIQSSRFHVGGHNWYMEWYPRGEDEDDADWASVLLCLDRHGTTNAEEVKASYRFALLDRAGKTTTLSSARSKRPRTFSATDASWGAERFVQRTEMASSVIKDGDCLRVRCDVSVVRASSHRLADLLLGQGRDVTSAASGSRRTSACSTPGPRASWRRSSTPRTTPSTITWASTTWSRPAAFKAFLHFVYTDSLPEGHCYVLESSSFRMAKGLLMAAERYDMERLRLITGRICIAMKCGPDRSEASTFKGPAVDFAKLVFTSVETTFGLA
ncbi:hypothetical protein U9M48_032062 [Paspalum notatum var. saurae]|uniref:MATH domain-containing protein n=1 Tax=Paspalum notatum var. saurae TaxID=547442 RepID=A0AAQ3X4D9_PASNO